MPFDEEQFKQAQKETEAAIASDPSRKFSDPTLPLFQYTGRLTLEENEKSYLSGDKAALLAAIRVCANHDLIMPPWVYKAFIRAYDEVLNCRSGSWDDVFGKPYPGKQIGALRKKREHGLAVYLDAHALIQAGAVVDAALFEAVADLHGIKKTLASSWYYEYSKRLLLNNDIGRTIESLEPRLRSAMALVTMKKPSTQVSGKKRRFPGILKSK